MRLAAIHTYPVKGCHRLDHDGARVEPWGLRGDRRWMVVDEDGVGVTQREVPALALIRPEPRPDGVLLRAAGRPDLTVPEPADGDALPVRVFRHHAPAAARVADAGAAEWLTVALDRKVRLVWLGDPTARSVPDTTFSAPADRVSFADGFPLLLATTASLDAVNDALLASGSHEAPLPMARFRPNLVVSGCRRPWQEEEWTGRRLRIGAAVFRVARPSPRCVVTTVDQETAEKGREPLRVLAAIHAVDQKLLFGQNIIPDGVTAGAEITIGDEVALAGD
ncbi:MOSC domain-containing protein [Solwaraspora sp. WMMD1047]|uniref:MOSC domain-containing protein n=1 Tax=Solwaraspora sp. WMMD1047 TaxID=3016102 RepID=UPI0024176468|nr:MOSC N-terminal beta barrel domain-containing protein [Solwaraspora sp. WMMD1047]MDG4829212.1 MOSC domain-containing protein [Solwaraspora sp. WMMD1047]